MKKITKALKSEKFIVSLIILNGVVLFLDSFDSIQRNFPSLEKIDLIINFFFFIEMFLKVKEQSFKKYISDNWNKFDFALNFLILFSFILFLGRTNYLVLTILRLIRLSKFFRILRFIPNIDHLLRGFLRALKSSVFVFVSFFLYLFICSILSTLFFREVSPEHFGDPFLSLYSTFKIFTVEGWYELPELISHRYGEINAFFVKIYFIFLVLTGGIFGLAFVNAIFVDELVSDNNDEVLRELKENKELMLEILSKLNK